MRKSKDSIIDFYKKHREFRYLESIHAHRRLNEENCSEYTLDIILCDLDVANGQTKMLLTFTNARDIKIGRLEGILVLMVNIRDISTDQMESINYEVVEEENNIFSFYCEDFYFKIV